MNSDREAAMTELSYSTSSVPVRGDLSAAHRRAWLRVGKAGNWWTGAERVAIAAEARNAGHCALCKARKAALSPYTISGEHNRVSELLEAAVDAIHRIVTDPGRLTLTWFKKTMASGQITDAQYVEIVDIVVTVVSIDSFCRGLGVPLHPLPQPQAGEPVHYRPASARMEAAWVPMIPVEGAIGSEADLWDKGRVGNVIRALSLVPDAVRQLMELSDVHYIPRERIMDLASGRSLSRAQMELIAARVSALRGCFY
jgi:hypothetical protein